MDLEAHQTMQMSNGKQEGRFLMLQGNPIQETQFGGWPWSRPDMVHPEEKGRFALHTDGREVFPG